MIRQATDAWEGPLFLIGMPRSGTKLLRNLLSNHPAISVLPWETEFLPFLEDWVRRNGPPADEPSFGRLAAALEGAPYFDYRRRQRTDSFSRQQWRRACAGQFDAAGLFEGFARAELGLDRGSGTIWGDKSPSYIERIDLVRGVFPAAKLIHIFRDVRDYSLSLNRSFGKDLRRAAHRWNAAVLRMHGLEAEDRERLISVSFESLLTDTANQLSRLCGFLGLEYTDAMLALERPVENHGNAKGLTGVVTSNFGRYRRDLSPRELRAIESIAWDGMHALGYEPELAVGPRRLGPAALKALRIKDGLTLIGKDVEGRGLLRSAATYLNDYRIKRSSAANS